MEPTVTHKPSLDKFGNIQMNNRYEIVGDNIDELISVCLKYIRPDSKEFYEKGLRDDLTTQGYSVISHFATSGILYKAI